MNYSLRPRYIIQLCLLIIVIFFSHKNLCAQTTVAIVKGRVVDSLSSNPLRAASVSVFDASKKKLINGIIASESGDFSFQLSFGKTLQI